MNSQFGFHLQTHSQKYYKIPSPVFSIAWHKATRNDDPYEPYLRTKNQLLYLNESVHDDQKGSMRSLLIKHRCHKTQKLILKLKYDPPLFSPSLLNLSFSSCVYKCKPRFIMFNVFSVYWQHEVPYFAEYSVCFVPQHWKGNRFLERNNFETCDVSSVIFLLFFW